MHGRYRTLLKEGETITTRSGLTVRPEEVSTLLCSRCTDMQAMILDGVIAFNDTSSANFAAACEALAGLGTAYYRHMYLPMMILK